MSDNHDPRAVRPPVTTTDAGIPTASDEHSLTAGPSGPILLQDHYLIQKAAGLQSRTRARARRSRERWRRVRVLPVDGGRDAVD